MTKLDLDIFVEGEQNVGFAEGVATGLKTAVRQLAPLITLDVDVRRATHVEPWTFEWCGQTRHAFKHAPSTPARQSLLITERDLGAAGWGARNFAVVSKLLMEAKESRGGDPIDIAIHEWLHTIDGMVIDGRAVPFVDNAEKCGFVGEIGPDGEARWSDWYRYCLGGK